MKMHKHFGLVLTACLVLSLLFTPVFLLPSQAANTVTVQGKVMSGTTGSLLLLDTPQGKMEIKIDNATDTTAGKILLPDQAISVTVTGGSDGYLHATKISTGNQIGNVIVDTNNTVDVTGTLNKNTKDNDLHLDTPQGEMIIRLDPSTEMGSCAFLVLNGKYRITCGRGSDAYLHAVKIADASSAANTSASVNGDNSAYPFINGTVDSKTTNNLLYLSTTGGTMQFVIDNNANTLKGLMMTSGRSLTVYYYHGNDGYLHAVTTVGARSSSSASVNTASTLTATGTVNGNSTENMLFLARFRQRNQRLQGSGHQPAHFRYLCVWLRRLSARGYDHCKTIECTLCEHSIVMNNRCILCEPSIVKHKPAVQFRDTLFTACPGFLFIVHKNPFMCVLNAVPLHPAFVSMTALRHYFYTS